MLFAALELEHENVLASVANQAALAVRKQLKKKNASVIKSLAKPDLGRNLANAMLNATSLVNSSEIESAFAHLESTRTIPIADVKALLNANPASVTAIAQQTGSHGDRATVFVTDFRKTGNKIYNNFPGLSKSDSSGSGYRERVRYNPCDPNPDAPPEVLTEPCAEEPIMCVASEWSEFGECDAECDGFGQMTRSRECACPEGADEDDEECGCGSVKIILSIIYFL